MKKKFIFVTALLLVACSWATPDIEFSPGGSNPGHWFYQGIDSTSGTFSFLQQIDIDMVQGAQTDALFQEFVYIPDLALTNYTSSFPGVGTGVLAAGGNIEIKDGSGTLLLSGTVANGSFYAVFATASAYPDISADVVVTFVNQSWGSAYLSSVNVGDIYDLNITIQASSNFDQMIKNVQTGQDGFSGSLTPEPATLLILAIGSLMLRKRA